VYAVVTLRAVETEAADKGMGAGGQGRLSDDRMLNFDEFLQALCRLAHLLRSDSGTFGGTASGGVKIGDIFY